MKKHICTGILLFLMGIGGIQAQNDTKLFQFISKTTDNDGDRLVLHHNLDDHSVGATKINSSNAYLQAFILQPIENEMGEVLIASAKAPDYFLKRNGNEVVFDQIGEQDLDAFRWSIAFHSSTDYDGASATNINIVTPEITGNSAISIQLNNSIINVNSILPNYNTIGDVKQIADPFVFTVQELNNVF